VLYLLYAGSSADCEEGYTACSDGLGCYRKGQRCDRLKDCHDGTDERDCQLVCEADEFACVVDDMCQPLIYKCDGGQDCSDNSDEQHCKFDPSIWQKCTSDFLESTWTFSKIYPSLGFFAQIDIIVCGLFDINYNILIASKKSKDLHIFLRRPKQICLGGLSKWIGTICRTMVN